MPPTNIKMTFPRTTGINTRGSRLRYHTEWHWHPRNAHTMRLIVAEPDSNNCNVWVTDRGLLTDGMNAPVGTGDITIAPTNEHTIEIMLRDHRGIGGNIALHYPRAALHTFVTRTYREVPAGAEHYEWRHADLFLGRPKDAA